MTFLSRMLPRVKRVVKEGLFMTLKERCYQLAKRVAVEFAVKRARSEEQKMRNIHYSLSLHSLRPSQSSSLRTTPRLFLLTLQTLLSPP